MPGRTGRMPLRTSDVRTSGRAPSWTSTAATSSDSASKPVPYAGLAVGAAAHDEHRRALHARVRERFHRIDELRLGDDHQLRDLGHRGERLDGPRDHRLPGQIDELFRPAETRAMPGRNDHRAPDHARAFGRAKIMRPAFVCSALVTATSTVSPIRRRPFSITIIVPSSR